MSEVSEPSDVERAKGWLTRDLPRCTEHLCHRGELLAEIERLTRELREAQECPSLKCPFEAEVVDLRAKLAAAPSQNALDQEHEARLTAEKMWRESEAKLAEERACHDCREYRAMMSAKLAAAEASAREAWDIVPEGQLKAQLTELQREIERLRLYDRSTAPWDAWRNAEAKLYELQQENEQLRKCIRKRA